MLKGLRNQLHGLPRLLLVCCLFATAAAYSAPWHWLLELFSHFHMQYVAVLTLLGLFYIWRRRLLALLVTLSLGGLNLLPIAGLLGADNASQAAGNDGNSWVLVSANLYNGNHDVDAALQLVATENPDVVVFQEYTLRWAKALTKLNSDYRYRFEVPQDGSFGLALFSRQPILSAEAITLGNSTHAIVATLTAGGGPVTIIAVHLRPPMTAAWAAERRQQFAALTELAMDTDLPLVVVGDFNATPWSPDFRHWKDTARLQNGLGGHGVAYTWPTGNPIFRIPIDACVVNSRLQVNTQHRGSTIGSDHYPLVTTLTTLHD